MRQSWAALALHEAGHATVAVLLGAPIWTAMLHRDRGLGETIVKKVDPMTDAIVAMAGWVANAHGSRHDLAEAAGLVGRDDMWEAAWRARCLLGPHPAAVQRVADELLLRGSLTGARIAELVHAEMGVLR